MPDSMKSLHNSTTRLVFGPSWIRNVLVVIMRRRTTTLRWLLVKGMPTAHAAVTIEGDLA
jgi:hypothetical protein